jgi:hypothetical protein
MKEILIDSVYHVGKGVAGVAGIQGVDSTPSGSNTLDTILKIIIVLATAGTPLLNQVKAIKSVIQNKSAS